MDDILSFLIPFVTKVNLERFTNETCDVSELKIKVLEEKLQLESIQAKTFPDKEINDKIIKLEEKIVELNKKILTQSDQILKSKEKSNEDSNEDSKEEEEIYSGIGRLVYGNYLLNGILIIFIFFLASAILYMFITSLFAYGKKRQLKLDNVNINYDSILDEIKKSKVKSSLKVKKGSFFNFLKNT